MLLNIEKIGDNFALKIPPAFAKQCGLDNGSQVNVKLNSDSIIIESTEQHLGTFTQTFRDVEENHSHSEIYYG